MCRPPLLCPSPLLLLDLAGCVPVIKMNERGGIGRHRMRLSPPTSALPKAHTTPLHCAPIVKMKERKEERGQKDGDASGRLKQSRSGKKSQKAMLKLGMKLITGLSRITVKKSKNASS
ncbi:hypothetical protein Nepgr_012083 [Nepenthes gracilis]|uniref:Uncharacterized protein n=1 Tax=Nepenthes gracilis TaxID=150966 RepID=A0AAD3XMJ0_NEPGR|nr:hypothetical protein Nepgr_012083 [Nepenthes gracilis]